MPSLLAVLPADLAPHLLPDLARALYAVLGVLALVLLADGFARIVGDNFRRDPGVAVAAFPRHLTRVVAGFGLLAALMVAHSLLTSHVLTAV